MSELPPIPDGFQLVPQGPALPPIPEGFKLVENSLVDSALGLAKAGGVGLVKGAIGLAGMPKDIPDLIEAGSSWGNKKLVEMGFPGAVPRNAPKVLENKMPGSADIQSAVESQTGKFREPETRAERYAQNIGEFVPAVLGGPGGLARKIITQAVVPGVASEAAGEATKGTGYETPARMLAGGLSGPAAAKIAGPSGLSNVLRSRLPDWVTDAHITGAENLIADAGARGLNLTWPEALSQVTGRAVLTTDQRIAESARQSRGQMQEFMGGRPHQVDTAVRQELDNIAPGTQAPSTIGPAVGDAAENTLSDVRRTINNATDPLYQAAEGTLLTRAEMAPIVRAPGWREARNAVRNTPQLNRYVAHLPDHSVGFLNEVKKYFDQAAENATHPMTAQRNAQIGAGYTRDAAAVRQAAIDASNRAAYPNPGTYEIALNAQQQTRQQFLEPLLQGPLGRVAGKDTTTKKAIEVLFPKDALPGSADEIATAVGAVAHRNPWAARQLVRAHMESELHKAFTASGRGQEGAQFAGARFALNVAGSPNVVTQQFENIHAALGALPNGQNIADGFTRLTHALQATGTREGKGSLTAFNKEDLQMMSTGTATANTLKHLFSPGDWWHLADHAIGRWQLGHNLNELARIITDPRSGNYLRTIARMPRDNPRTMIVIGKMIAASTTEYRAKKPEDRK